MGHHPLEVVDVAVEELGEVRALEGGALEALLKACDEVHVLAVEGGKARDHRLTLRGEPGRERRFAGEEDLDPLPAAPGAGRLDQDETQVVAEYGDEQVRGKSESASMVAACSASRSGNSGSRPAPSSRGA